MTLNLMAANGRVNSAFQGRSWLPFLLSLLLLLATWVPALADDAADLINELMCPSDCVETLAICQMPEAAQMRSFVKEKVAAGWSKEKIVDNLVSQYGERILAAPPKKGFNLTAWVTPFAAILAGGGLISVLLVGWVRQRRVNDVFVKAQVTESDRSDLEQYRSRLAAELESYE